MFRIKCCRKQKKPFVTKFENNNNFVFHGSRIKRGQNTKKDEKTLSGKRGQLVTVEL